jgi:hypothetical protein
MWRHCSAALRFTNSSNNLPTEPQAPDRACSFTPTSLLPSAYWRRCHLFWAFKGCVLIKTSTLCLFKSRLILSYSLIIDLPPSLRPSRSDAETLHVFLITISLLHITLLWLTSLNLTNLIKRKKNVTIFVMHFFPSSLNVPSLSNRYSSQYHALVVVRKVTKVLASSPSVFLKTHFTSFKPWLFSC